MPDALDQLKDHLGRIDDLEKSAAVLEWDQETFMPEGGAEARAQQIATLRELAHQRFASDATGELLERAAGAEAEEWEKDLVRVARRDFLKAQRVPSELVARLARTVSRAKQAWKKARSEDEFAAFAPLLEQLVQLSIEQAEHLGYEEHAYDALLDQYEEGMTTAEVRSVFEPLREELIPIVEAIGEQSPPDDAVLHRRFDPEAQWDFGLEVIRDFGYDMERGRQDRSTHPFTTTFSTGDVRLTTRIDPQFFNPGFFGTLHEAGHGLYEQGIDPQLDRTPLASGTSLGMHESQSRLWENQIGRSRAFWSHYFQQAQERFPEALGSVDLETFHRAINRVEPSLIRVEADEVTYPLHIMLRFEIETGLVDGSVAVGELPDLWNARMEEYLGLTPPNDAEGVLQDIHWSLGAIGYFPTYALGTLMSAQLYEAAERDLGALDEQVGSGSFEPLLGWLRTHVHQWGRRRSANEILKDVTQSGLRATPWLDYIQDKYGALYALPAG